MAAMHQRTENCSDLSKNNKLKSHSWLGISLLERGKEKNCYYKKDDVEKILDEINGQHEAEANQLRGELNDCEKKAKITMQDVNQQQGETDEDYIKRIHKELFDSENRRIPLVHNYMRVLGILNQSALPNPQLPHGRGIINKNQKKKRKSKKRKSKKRKTKNKKRKSKKKKPNKKRNKTKKSKK